MPAELTSTIPEIALSLDPRSKRAARGVAEFVEERAKDNVSVGPEPYHIRDDIHIEEIEDGYAVVAGREKTYYGHILEFGGQDHPANPFLIPAFEEGVEVAEELGAIALRGL